MRRSLAVLGVVALGGALGSMARHALTLALPTAGFPISTLLANVTGCVLIGALMVIIEAGDGHRLLRPFFGVGVLGGYTTLSTYAVETITLLRADHAMLALAYALLTVLLCLVAVLAGAWTMRAIRR